ncbi:copper homeostasis protein CutC [Marinilongibacter aquaticus]|uniref:copper homeostasis protein CutC n=1 Tax=Marinilongibacter aquaticus TaxID=2975157 RepID=UPI0021BD1CE0|nr:copper homeostasis protein CutC [Marinilongibacter aquaticus]UBM57823.1 copper homeostasis protein CutC [Marinilongibacter aquaticus]
MSIQTEICCYSYLSAQRAHQAGVDRIEVCGGFGEGGTTPSHGLVRLCVENLSPKAYVMIRPRGGDFVYSKEEQEVIEADLFALKSLKPAGFVFGALTPDGEVDVTLCKKVVEWAQPFPLTFHRAFDYAKDPFLALEQIIELGFERILTSGQAANAVLGLDLLKQLTEKAKGRIQIMAGAGVNEKNAGDFVAAGLPALHSSLKVWEESPFKTEKEIDMASGLPDLLGHYESSPEKLQQFIQNTGKK